MRWFLEFEHWVTDKALHSELLSELSSQVSSWNEFSRVGTSSEKARKTCSDPNFWKTAISKTRENENCKKTQIFAKKSQKFMIFAIFASLEMLGKLGNYQNISKIRKMAISETRKNENFGKKCLTQGPSYWIM